MAMPDDEIWEWTDSGTPDKRSDRGRVYYKSVSVRRRNSTRRRSYNVGDPVVMSGDDGQVWIAQIVNLFQAQENDIHIKELIRNSTARNEDERRNELMRCTLRWFYNVADMDQHTLNMSRTPKPVPDEIWFSDHVEQDGYNDVQVIEGRAWLFPSVSARQAFVKDPDPLYDKRKDKLRLVRCFVDSNSDHRPVRELERTELDRLLRNPTTDKDLFENSRLRLYGSAGAVLKGTGKKKRRHTTIRSPVNVEEDEFVPAPPQKRSRPHGVEAKVELGLKGTSDTETTKGRSFRRRKIIDNDDDEEGGAHAKPVKDRQPHLDDDDTPLSNRIQTLDQQQQAAAKRIERENEEVFAWVTELNNNAYNGEVDERPKPSEKRGQPSKPSMAVEINEVSVIDKASSARPREEVNGKQPKEQKPRRRETETIVIDDDGDAETSGRRPMRPKVLTPPRLDKKQVASRQGRHPVKGKSTFMGKPFMPTQRSRKPSSASVRKSTTANRTGTATPQQKTSEPGAMRHSLEKVPNVPRKPSEKIHHARKDVPQSSTRQERTPGVPPPSNRQERSSGTLQSVSRQERTSRHHARPADKEFLSEITTAMDKMKLGLSKIPGESKSVLKGKMEWVVGSVIEKMFDGRKERANDVGDTEVRKIVDLTFAELQSIYGRGLKGSRNVDGSRSGAVEV